MTTETRAVAPAAASSGHLVAAEDLVGGQYVHVRPLARSGREWCQIRGAKRLRYYMRLELVRSDGVEFWWKVFPSHMLRTLATAAPDAPPESEAAQAKLRELFPDTQLPGPSVRR